MTLRRLNRAELDRTVRDLLLTERSVAARFPEDDVGNGFDNQADVLSLSPLHLELLDAMADELVTYDVLAPPLPVRRTRWEAEELTGEVGGSTGEGWMLWSNGALAVDAPVGDAGRHRVAARLVGLQAGPDPVRAALLVDGALALEVDLADEDPVVVEVELDLSRGYHELAVAFTNDWYEEGVGDRNLVVDWIELEGPFDAFGAEPPGHDVVFTCDPAAGVEPDCARQIAAGFGERAWRRPLTEGEIASLVDVYEAARAAGEDPERAVGWMVRALLVSPSFLFKVEADPAPGESPRRLSDHELASRLSYFLWGTMPDAELFAAARAGRLHDEDELREQVARMLADPRAVALVDEFAAQWLSVRAVGDAFPDPGLFPGFDQRLRDAMREEMRRQIASVLLADRPLSDLLVGRTTWVDDALAAHYGLPAPGGWAEVSLDGTGRAGVLTTAGWLTALSYPTRTSPVRRGAWVLANVLCEAPPPPPPGVEALDQGGEAIDPSLSVRERLEAHRADPSCRSCHQSIDPIGFAFEGFDAVGARREVDGAAPVDASGRLPDGFAFDGAEELLAYLAESPKFDRCATWKTFTWALGRAPTVEDLAHLEPITAAYVASDRRFAALVAEIALSEPFRYRAAPEAE